MNSTKTGRDQIARIDANDKKNGTTTKVVDAPENNNTKADSQTSDPKTGTITLPKNAPTESIAGGKKQQTSFGEVCVHELDHREKVQDGTHDDLKKTPAPKFDNKLEKSAIDAQNKFNAEDKDSKGNTRQPRVDHK